VTLSAIWRSLWFSQLGRHKSALDGGMGEDPVYTYKGHLYLLIIVLRRTRRTKRGDSRFAGKRSLQELSKPDTPFIRVRTAWLGSERLSLIGRAHGHYGTTTQFSMYFKDRALDGAAAACCARREGHAQRRTPGTRRGGARDADPRDHVGAGRLARWRLRPRRAGARH
jgi:hypothetical protein